VKAQEYKYRLSEDFRAQTNIKGEAFTICGGPSEPPWAHLASDGMLYVRAGYCWDGASGPTIDKPRNAILESSCVHDCLYQAMRDRKLPESFRPHADALMRDMLIERGVWKWRAWGWYYALRWFAGFAAKPTA